MPILIRDQSDGDVRLWRRIIEKRRKDIQGLDESTIESIVSDLWQACGEHDPCNSSAKVEKLLNLHLRICSNEDEDPSRRRKSLESFKKLVEKIDCIVGSESVSIGSTPNSDGGVDTSHGFNGRYSTTETDPRSLPLHSQAVVLREVTETSEKLASQSIEASLPLLSDAMVSTTSIPGSVSSNSKRKFSDLPQVNNVEAIVNSSPFHNRETERNASPMATVQVPANRDEDLSHRSPAETTSSDVNVQPRSELRSSKQINSVPSNAAASEMDSNRRRQSWRRPHPFLERMSDVEWHCTLCDCTMSLKNVESHVAGKRHKQNVNQVARNRQEQSIRPSHWPVASHDNLNCQQLPSNTSSTQPFHESSLAPFQNSLPPPRPSLGPLSNTHVDRFDYSQRNTSVPVVPPDNYHEINNHSNDTQRRVSASDLEVPASRTLSDHTEPVSEHIDGNRSYVQLDKNARTADNGLQVSSEEHRKSNPNNSQSIESLQRNNPQLVEGSPISVIAYKDGMPSVARAVRERLRTEVSFRPQELDPLTAKQAASRLREWDPFWRNIGNAAVGITSKVFNLKPRPDVKSEYAIERAAHIDFDIARHKVVFSMNIAWGKKVIKKNDAVLLLRMLPLDPGYYKKKRADCHLWPKGTFVQINERPIQLLQRKQQDHDTTLWKGMCKDLDMVEHIADPSIKHNISIFTIDKDAYIFLISLCQYRSVDEIFEMLMDQDGTQAITRLTRDESMQKAMTFAGKQMLVVDSDEEPDKEQLGKFVFSLTCPISKQPMKVPVRGKKCKHYQVSLENMWTYINAWFSWSYSSVVN